MGKGLALERNIGDVRIAIVIEIAKIQSHAGDEGAVLGQSDIGLKSHFLELVSQVMKEEIVLRVVGHEEIRLAVQIVVGHAHAHSLADVVANAPLL